MFGRAISRDLLWDSAAVQTADQSQRWILAAMQKHGPGLITMLWRILGNEQDVCDAYQSIFLQLAHYEFRQKPENVKAYLFRTASNTAVSMLRRKIAERRTLCAAGGGDQPPTADQFDAKQLAEILRYYVAQLPEHFRNVVTLRDLAELPYAQVGRMLGISAATARVYRCKAIQLLAVWMNQEREDEK